LPDAVDDEAVLRLSMSTCLSRRLSDHIGEFQAQLSTEGGDVDPRFNCQAKDYLPSSSLRRIIHLQTELLKASGSTVRTANDGQRTLLSSQQPDINGSSDATALLLGVTGRNKLFAAGDKLRELIVPDVLASAVSVVGAGMGAGIGIGGRDKKGKKDGVRDEAKMETLRMELDALMASSCVICEVSCGTGNVDIGPWGVRKLILPLSKGFGCIH
jgi:hypothetical protein